MPTTLTSQRWYDRIYREHIAPALGEDRANLRDLVAALSSDVAPPDQYPRGPLYQAMARRARGDLKRMEARTR